MDGSLGILASGDGGEARRLRDQSAALLERLDRLALDDDGTRVRLLVGWRDIVATLRTLEPSATRSSLVMQPQYSYDPEEPGIAMTKAARARGVVTELITRPATVEHHPLLSSIFPNTLIGPCFLRAAVIDERRALVGGPEDLDGNRTAWFTDVPEIVDDVCDLWRSTVPLCRPILAPGERPPLTERQLDVARLLCVGEKDKAIARLLKLSARTVEREVSAILVSLGAGSRTEAVLAMRGRGVNGGHLAPSGG